MLRTPAISSPRVCLDACRWAQGVRRAMVAQHGQVGAAVGGVASHSGRPDASEVGADGPLSPRGQCYIQMAAGRFSG